MAVGEEVKVFAHHHIIPYRLHEPYATALILKRQSSTVLMGETRETYQRSLDSSAAWFISTLCRPRSAAR